MVENKKLSKQTHIKVGGGLNTKYVYQKYLGSNLNIRTQLIALNSTTNHKRYLNTTTDAYLIVNNN